jgi:hypothetical protein
MPQSSIWKPGDKVQLRVTLGDRKPDGNSDVTFEAYAVVPFAGSEPVKIADVTISPPIEEIPRMLASAMGSFAPLAGGMISGSLPLLISEVTKLISKSGDKK